MNTKDITLIRDTLNQYQYKELDFDVIDDIITDIISKDSRKN